MSFYTVQPGDTIQLAPQQEPHAPDDIKRFLEERGWISNSGVNWQHHAKNRWNMNWEQAMACEFFDFITLGGR